MLKDDIYLVDFEGNLAGGIVEYGLVRLSLTQGIIEVNTRLCKPQVPILLRESKCHGIFNQDLVHCPSFTEDLTQFMCAHKQGIFCAHNAIFENQMLCKYCPFPPVNEGLYVRDEKLGWGPWIDTYGLYKRLLPPKTNCKLEHLVSRYHLDEELCLLAEKYCPLNRRQYHCALFDALASALLLLNFLYMPQHQDKDVAWLIAYSSLGIKSLTNRLQTDFLWT